MADTAKTIVSIVLTLIPVVKLLFEAFGVPLPDFQVLTEQMGDGLVALVGAAGTVGLAKSPKLGK